MQLKDDRASISGTIPTGSRALGSAGGQRIEDRSFE
jgi:hypothetical protein